MITRRSIISAIAGAIAAILGVRVAGAASASIPPDTAEHDAKVREELLWYIAEPPSTDTLAGIERSTQGFWRKEIILNGERLGLISEEGRLRVEPMEPGD